MNPDLQTLGQSLENWQALYIFSMAVALLSTFAIVVFAFHIQEHKSGLKASNYVYVVASLMTVISTIVIVNKTRSIDLAKDRGLKIETQAAEIKISQANLAAAHALASAGIANQEAKEAEARAEETSTANGKLRIEVAHEEIAARSAELELSKQNKETLNFAHSLQQQQQNMEDQAHVSPVLNQDQIDQLAIRLRLYAGQTVSVHTTLDTTVLRLSVGIQTGMRKANITTNTQMDAGSLYQGISVAVHSPTDIPPLANALVLGLQACGIAVHTVSIQDVPAGRVSLYLGPN